jgi:hypothetical protein
MIKMTRRINPIVVVKEVDLDISSIYSHNHMVEMDKTSFSEMTSLIKFNFFWFYRAIIHKTMQSTKRQGT